MKILCITDTYYWEHGYLMHALSLHVKTKVKLITISKGKKSIKTAGGMKGCSRF